MAQEYNESEVCGALRCHNTEYCSYSSLREMNNSVLSPGLEKTRKDKSGRPKCPAMKTKRSLNSDLFYSLFQTTILWKNSVMM